MSVAPLVRSNTINADNAIVETPCMQLVDASFRLLPVSQLIETLQDLLARTEGNVSEHSSDSRLRADLL